MLAIKDLSAGDLEVILKHLSRRELEKNQILFEEAHEASSMFFLETGALKVVSRKAMDGRDDVMLGAIKPGGYCGEVALLRENALYEDTVVAMETSVVLELSKAAMQKIMLASMTAGTKLLLGISRNIREAIAMPQQQEMAKIIAFVAPKDGSGRTTAATHLGTYLAKAGKRVVFIDCDMQLGDAHVHLGMASQPHIARLIQIEERLSFETIKKYFQNVAGLQLLAAPSQPQEAEFVTRSNLNQIIQETARNCDYLILDVPSHIDEISILLWDMADLMVFVAEGNIAALTRMKRLLVAIERLNYPKEKFMGLLNKFSEEQGEYLENYRKIMPHKWMTLAYNSKVFQQAMLKGYPVWQIDSAAAVAKDMQAFCQQILGKTPQSAEKGGIFGRIKSMFA
ncbi:MAG: cyclic nucleotide-binding domain-containing protein [Erysipelotrichia bacterium]|nr:cyclic nucleotide-binding domain-containing protein [Erysipelotrichia bacterium]